MSRYRTEGIVRDLEAGKHVVLMSHRYRQMQHVFRQVEHSIPPEEIERLTRANGNERITMCNGGQLNLNHTNDARGLTADIVVYLGWSEVTDVDTFERICDRIGMAKAELVQA